MAWVSALYPGRVTHGRSRPRPHRLAYDIFMLLADLDEAPNFSRAFRLLSHGRFNLISFRERDHGDGSDRPLKAQVEAHLAAAGLPFGGPVRLLCMPAILGGAFNPLSVYFCHGPDGGLTAILYEVNNTFGERHAYLIPVTDERAIRQTCDKVFYVSPFMDMGLTYAFRINPPGEAVGVTIQVSDADGPLLNAGFTGRRVELSDAALLRAWTTHPWMTLGVLAAIHWEALKIWLKGEKVRERPAPPAVAVTVAPAV